MIYSLRLRFIVYDSGFGIRVAAFRDLLESF
jgi:hypothetical protein